MIEKYNLKMFHLSFSFQRIWMGQLCYDKNCQKWECLHSGDQELLVTLIILSESELFLFKSGQSTPLHNFPLGQSTDNWETSDHHQTLTSSDMTPTCKIFMADWWTDCGNRILSSILHSKEAIAISCSLFCWKHLQIPLNTSRTAIAS